MAYVKQNFTDGQVLKAEHLNHIEDGISDAGAGGGGSITADEIKDALGYTPAKQDDIPTTEISANTAARHTHSNKTTLDSITGIVTVDKVTDPDNLTDIVNYAAFTAAINKIIAQIPKSNLTIKYGDTSTVFNGSEARSIEIDNLVDKKQESVPQYTNVITTSTDSSGNVLNEKGYIENSTLNSSGEVIEASGDAYNVTGFIAIKKGDVVRIKESTLSSVAGRNTHLIAVYGSDKATATGIAKTIEGMRNTSAYGAITISGDTVTWDTSSISYYYWSDVQYMRVGVGGNSPIITINEEIKSGTQTVSYIKDSVRVNKASLTFDIPDRAFNDRNVVVFGDSIIGMVRDETSVTSYLAEYTGANVVNAGFGGCRMSVHPTEGYAAFSMWALADAITSGDWSLQEAQASKGSDYFSSQLATLKTVDFSKVDYIIIHYGTNDYAAAVDADDSSDKFATSNLFGALRYSVRKILQTYPKIRIFISGPCYRMWDTTTAEDKTNSNNKHLSDDVETMKSVAKELHCHFIDSYNELGVNQWNNGTYTNDGTHPTDVGRKMFGEFLGGALMNG